MTQDHMFEHILRVLNDAVACDKNAMHSLCANRVPCNAALAAHPYVQVDAVPFATFDHEELCQVGMVGVLNGIIEPLTGKRIATQWSSDTDTDGRRQFFGFCEFVSREAKEIVR